ncbi:MAG: hypothetical protein ACXACI_18355 [Candidatus Hodarchaeales archaeon]|jgi:hypothetical protein
MVYRFETHPTEESGKNFCNNCGTPFFPGDQFCASCGDSIISKIAPAGRPKALVPEEYSHALGFLVRPNEEVEEFFELAKWPFNSRKSFAVITDQGWVCFLDQFVTRNIASFSIAEIKKMKIEPRNWPLMILGAFTLIFSTLIFPLIIGIALILKGWEMGLSFETEYFGPFTIRGSEYRLRGLYAQIQRKSHAQEKKF